MTILLLGANGQVGWELRRALIPLGNLIACGRNEANFEDLDALRQLVHQYRPQIIVNAAAYTAVDKAESNVKVARRINADAVDLLATEAKTINAWLIHYSTDYVFDGKHSGFYSEDDEPKPLNVYGQTKLEGEQLLQASRCNYLLFRTSWVYSARGSNFVRTILRLAQEKDKINVVSDQVGAPTSAEFIADITAIILHQIKKSAPDVVGQYSGIYHLSANGQTSWYGFAKCIIEQAIELGFSTRAPLNNLCSIATADYPLPALRPSNSLLNTSKLCGTFGVSFPYWEDQVRRVVTEFLQKGIV
jgi:dTDP-4-dehydrorhamnose reductase